MRVRPTSTFVHSLRISVSASAWNRVFCCHSVSGFGN